MELNHKCNGCRYQSEHQEMGFRPFGVCTKETNLIEAERAYKSDVCPYKQNEKAELNSENVKKALRICWDTTCSDCEFDNNCGGHWQVLENAEALINSYEQKIKELTEERTDHITMLLAKDVTIQKLTDEIADLKAIAEQYQKQFEDCYEEKARLTEENERLRAENAKYEAENHEEFNKWLKLEEATKRHHAELFEEAKIAVKEDTVRKMQERLNESFNSHSYNCRDCIKSKVDQIAKEMLEDIK